MSVVTTNIRLNYRRPALWVAYIIVTMFFVPFFAKILSGNFIRSQSVYTFQAFLGILFLGVISGSFWKTILSKSCTFCLPNSRVVPRNMFFILGGVINLFISLLFTYSRWPETVLYALQVFFPVFFAGMFFYLAGVLSTYQSTVNNLWVCFSFFWILMFISSVNRFFEIGIVAHPLIIIPIGIALCVFAWFWLGRESLRRTLCTTPSTTLFDNWNLTKVKQIREQQAARKNNPSDERRRDRREAFFLSRMKQYDALSVGRYCWGWLYRIFGNPIHKIGLHVIVWLLVIGFFTFMPSPTMQWWIFLMPTFIAGMNLPLPLKHSLLLPASRNTGFRSVLILLPTYAMLILLFLVIIGLFWQGFHVFVPQIMLAGKTYTSSGFQWPYLFVTSFSLPLCFLIRRLVPRDDTAGRMIVVIFLAMTVVPAWLVITTTYPNGIVTYYAILLVLTVLLWPLCFLAYRNYFKHSKLTWPGRT